MRYESYGKKINKKLEEYYIGYAHRGYLCNWCFHYFYHSFVDSLEKWECVKKNGKNMEEKTGLQWVNEEKL